MNSISNYEQFSKTIENTDHSRLCRFCLAEGLTERFESKRIAQLFKQITNEELSFSPSHPTFVCNICQKSLQTAARIRMDIIKMEKFWTKYIDQTVVNEIKIEEVDDENMTFETVEMIIEPVSSGFDGDVDYLDMDMKYNFETKIESYGFDCGSIDDGSEFDDTRDGNSRVTRISSIADKHCCEHCDVSCLTRFELRTHQQNCHPETMDVPQFVCDICQKTYSSRYGIRTHMKRHMQIGSTEIERCKRVKRYTCSSCDDRFSKKVQLVEHELKHSGVTLHVCHICGISKKTKSLMNHHLNSHNPAFILKRASSARSKPKSTKRYFTCWMCPTRVDFKSLDELKTHRKNLHHDFQCKFCKNGFMTNEALQSHILIHGTQERPHLCKYCGGTFAKIGHLNSHIQGKHAKEKPYPCDKCPKGFVHRYQLQSHIRIFHEKIKAFQCTECPTSFGHAKSRVWHMRTVHKM